MESTAENQSIMRKQGKVLENDMFVTYKSLCEKHKIGDKTSNIDVHDKIRKLITEKMQEISKNKQVDICSHKLEEYDKSTYIHSVRVAVLCMIIGKLLDFDKNKIIELGIAGLLHDIGKLFIPIAIITKPGRLDEIERVLINSHPASSAYYLRENYSSISEDVIWGVAEHHERIDGTGYPRHLKGDEISLIGRIIAIADVFEAYSSHRSYHKERSIAETVEFIQRVHGLDQEILSIFISHVDITNSVMTF